MSNWLTALFGDRKHLGAGRSARARRQLSLEKLEARLTMAGDVAATMSGANALGTIGSTAVFRQESIGAPADVDMYKFAVQAGQRLGVDIDTPTNGPPGLGSYLRIFDATGRELAANNDRLAPGDPPPGAGAGSTGFDSYIDYTFPTAGTYYAGVSNWQNQSYNPVSGTSSLGSDTRWLTGTYSLVVATVTMPAPAPANNNFSNRTTISGTSATVTGTNVSATQETGEPNHAGKSGGKSVWWTWRAPSNGSVQIDTIGSNFDTVLGVYTGSRVSSLTATASDDDSGGNNASKVTFNAVSGTTYQIAVDGYWGASGTITLHLSTTPSGPIAGWSSKTGYRSAATAVQLAIVSNASAAVGGSSGPSRVAPNGMAGAWLTDVSGGDGGRMQSATQVYHKWYVSQPRASVMPSSVRNSMFQKFDGSVYGRTQKDMLINRIVEVYNRAAFSGPVSIPTNDQATLEFLGIRRQCLEWTASIALDSGGKAKNYSAPSVTNPADIRAGMGLFKTDKSHAMIIVDIEWDASGKPVCYKVAEANAANSTWKNPSGMIPWERSVQFRIVPADKSTRVVNFEA